MCVALTGFSHRPSRYGREPEKRKSNSKNNRNSKTAPYLPAGEGL